MGLEGPEEWRPLKYCNIANAVTLRARHLVFGPGPPSSPGPGQLPNLPICKSGTGLSDRRIFGPVVRRRPDRSKAVRSALQCRIYTRRFALMVGEGVMDLITRNLKVSGISFKKD